MTEISDDELMAAAREAQKNAYAPYSKFLVGAAILDDAGVVHRGCNVENAAYPQGACAEANAIGAMALGGGRRIVKIAVVGGSGDVFCAPCGGCRQRINEFADGSTQIIAPDGAGGLRHFTINDLLPDSFGPSDLA